MPRRPSKKAKGKPRGVKRSEAKIKKWNDRSDIPLDEEDEFHASRDEILLDGNREYEDGDMEDDEIFALKGLPEDDDEDEEEEEEEEEAYEEEVDPEESLAQARKRLGSGKARSESSEESEEETWGRNKSAYYSSNAAQLESDDEEGNRLEEQEVKKLQKKSRDEMQDDDFGLNDPIEVVETPDRDTLEEPVVSVIESLPQDKTAIIRHLEKTDPESLALARDWTDTAQALIETKQKLEKLEGEDSEALVQGLTHLHYQALLTYATTLAFYLHLRASEKYAQKPEVLKSHPIMARLLTLKQSLITLEELVFADEDDESFGQDDDDLVPSAMMMDAERLWSMNEDMEGVDADELNDLLADAQTSSNIKIKIKPRTKNPDTVISPPKKKRKTVSEFGQSALPVFDLVEPEFTISSKSPTSRSQAASADAFGEATALQHADAADKSARRKSLRFHTSRIESTSAKRQGARNLLGGDDDIPYRERQKEKEDRLAREAKARVKSQGGMDLDDVDPEPRRQVDNDGPEDEDGYYELVKRQTKDKKANKKVEYEAARAERVVADQGATFGPRSLTRAILVNKGLTPHRPKSVRNPRVKKRERFEKAKKKVASQKAVYKGGVSTTGGRYEGEKSGITKVVKSVRLS